MIEADPASAILRDVGSIVTAEVKNKARLYHKIGRRVSSQGWVRGGLAYCRSGGCGHGGSSSNLEKVAMVVVTVTVTRVTLATCLCHGNSR